MDGSKNSRIRPDEGKLPSISKACDQKYATHKQVTINTYTAGAPGCLSLSQPVLA